MTFTPSELRLLALSDAAQSADTSTTAKRRRALMALAAGRVPGTRGRPRKAVKAPKPTRGDPAIGRKAAARLGLLRLMR